MQHLYLQPCITNFDIFKVFKFSFNFLHFPADEVEPVLVLVFKYQKPFVLAASKAAFDGNVEIDRKPTLVVDVYHENVVGRFLVFVYPHHHLDSVLLQQGVMSTPLLGRFQHFHLFERLV